MNNLDKLLKETLEIQRKIDETLNFIKDNKEYLTKEHKDKLEEIKYNMEEELLPEIEKLVKNKNLNLLNIDKRTVVVISFSLEDFKLWKNNSKLKPDGLDRQRRFVVGNTTYYCVFRVNDLCSITVDEIIETERAKENKEYEQIKLIARGNMKVSKS